MRLGHVVRAPLARANYENVQNTKFVRKFVHIFARPVAKLRSNFRCAEPLKYQECMDSWQYQECMNIFMHSSCLYVTHHYVSMYIRMVETVDVMLVDSHMDFGSTGTRTLSIILFMMYVYCNSLCCWCSGRLARPRGNNSLLASKRGNHGNNSLLANKST